MERLRSGELRRVSAFLRNLYVFRDLDGFIREMKIRFPDATARAPLSPGMSGDPVHTGSLPAIVGVRQIDLKKRTR